MELEIESPSFRSDRPLGIMYSSGTRLGFKATIKSALGIATDQATQIYVGKGQTGWVVFKDPDNCLEIAVDPGVPMAFQRECLSLLYPHLGPDDYPDASIVPDETFLQFTADRDAAGLADFTWNSALSDPLLSGEPVFLGLTKNLIGGDPQPKLPEEFAIGPGTGGTAFDGFGYGADDDLPGLVMLSNHGVGIVYVDTDGDPGTRRADMNPVYPRALRNLAGFLESVSYELKSNLGKTTIYADMTLPDGLIAPIISIDSCLSGGNPDEPCDGISQYQVDGGAFQYDSVASSVDLWATLIGGDTFEVRAFLVSGHAPSQVADMNLDGIVTAADAKLAGYKVISNEAVTRFRQYPAFLCGEQNALSTLFGVDYDGNGKAEIHIQCPPGPGALKGIP